MTSILLKLFTAVMSIIVTFSGMAPELFDGNVYIHPYGEQVVYKGEQMWFEDDSDFGEKYMVLSDYEAFEAATRKMNYDSTEHDEKFFENNSLVYIQTSRRFA